MNAKEKNNAYAIVNDFTVGSLCRSLWETINHNGNKKKSFFSIKLDSETEDTRKYVYKEISNMRLEDCLDLIFGLLVYGKLARDYEDENGDTPFSELDGPDYAYKRTRIKQNEDDISDGFKKIIKNITIEDLTHNIHEVLELYLKENDKKREILDFARKISLRGVQEPYTMETVFYNFLKKYPEGVYSMDDEFIDDVTDVFAECLLIAFRTNNKDSYTINFFKSVPSLRKKSKEQYIYDPHKTFSYTESQLAQSTALKFCLISKRTQERNNSQIYYSVERLLKFIQKNACIIQDIEIDEKENSVNVIVKSFYNTNYTLEWCDEPEQIENCVALVDTYKKEFHKKLSWKSHDYKIESMCQDGLNSGKWRALAYFHIYRQGEKNMCAFCDTKRRVDGNIELGIAVCHEDYRDNDFVSSIIFFLILHNFGSTIYGGTYEENKPMNSIFVKCQFKEHINYDYEAKEESYRVSERFTSDIPPENPNDLGNSIYYQRQSLQSEVISKLIVEKAKRVKQNTRKKVNKKNGNL